MPRLGASMSKQPQSERSSKFQGWLKASIIISIVTVTIAFITIPCWDSQDTFAVQANFDELRNDAAIAVVQVYQTLIVCFSLSLYLALEVSLRRYFGQLVEGFYIYILNIPTMIIQDGICLLLVASGYLQIGWSMLTAVLYVTLVCHLMYQYRFSGAVWDPRLIFFLLLVNSIRMVASIFSEPLINISDAFEQPWAAINVFCTLTSAVITMCQFPRHLLYLRKKSDSILSSDYCGAVISFLLLYIDTWTIALKTSPVFNHTITAPLLIVYILFYKIVDVINFCLLCRLSFIEQHRNADAIQQKRDVIRHVAHEIRTPLNVVSMGIIYLRDNLFIELEKLVASHCSEDNATAAAYAEGMLRDIAQDKSDVLEAQQACAEGIALLNDLLMYEMLESKQLVLEKMHCPILPLLQICFEGLPSQQQIEYSVTDATVKKINEADTVLVDDKRLAYALKNLLNYASSIYQPDSSIVVNVAIVQDASTLTCPLDPETTNSFLRKVAPDSIVPQHTHKIRILLSSVQSQSRSHIELVVADKSLRESLLNGRFDCSLRLYVCEGIVRLHGGRVRVKWGSLRGASTPINVCDLSFEVDVPFTPTAIMIVPNSFNTKGEEGLRDEVIGENIRHEEHVVSLPAAIAPGRRSPLLSPQRRQSPMLSSPSREPLATQLLQLELPLTRVLCVDDAPTSLKMLGRLFKANSVCVDMPDTATDGAQALAKVKESMQKSAPYELVIIDYEMHVMDGPAAVSLCREAGYSGIVIGLTGNALQEDVDYFIGKGADNVVSKPLDISSLKEIIVRKYHRCHR